MRTVVLVRHGESQYNVMKRFAGWLDCDLTADGIEQAKGERDRRSRNPGTLSTWLTPQHSEGPVTPFGTCSMKCL